MQVMQLSGASCLLHLLLSALQRSTTFKACCAAVIALCGALGMSNMLTWCSSAIRRSQSCWCKTLLLCRTELTRGRATCAVHVIASPESLPPECSLQLQLMA